MSQPRFPIRFPAGRISVDANTGCWQWLGSINGSGYAVVKLRGVQHNAHRLIYEIFMGHVPKELHVDHLCRNRGCVNPEHMDPVYPRVNIMRGEGPAAYNARKTHCKRGHPLSGENLVVDRITGKRACRTCKRATTQRYHQRKKGLLACP